MSDEEILAIRVLAMPADTNAHGTIFGGWVLGLIDQAGAVAANRAGASKVVTVSMHEVVFKAPVHVGELLHVHARLTWTGRTSMEVAVAVDTERPLTGVTHRANTAYLVFVALDANGKPVMVPPLRLDTSNDRAAWTDAEARRARRLAQV